MNGSFWRGRRVLVTGHTGFKGGWLALWLQSLGAEVTGFALAPPRPGFFESVRLGQGLRSAIGDIRQADLVERSLREARPEIVFHLAAQALVRASYADPVGTYATNVLGSVHLLEAVRREPSVRAVVVVTSDKCYENLESPRGYREDDRLGGHDPYSSSKACTEIVAAAYQRAFFSATPAKVPVVATARAGNVIGGGDWSEDRLIPDTVRAIADDASPEIRNPSAVRPWQHVLEPLRGYLTLAERLCGADAAAFAGAWNFGPGETDARPVSWVVEQFLTHWGLPPQWIRAAGEHPHETNFLRLDSSKAARALGWRPVLRIEQALADTVSWYRAHAAGSDMRQFSLDQIGAYAGLPLAAARGEGAACR